MSELPAGWSSKRTYTNAPDDQRYGAKWTQKEEADLLKSFVDQFDFEDLARMHKRTMRSVQIRMFQIIENPTGHTKKLMRKVRARMISLANGMPEQFPQWQVLKNAETDLAAAQDRHRRATEQWQRLLDTGGV